MSVLQLANATHTVNYIMNGLWHIGARNLTAHIQNMYIQQQEILLLTIKFLFGFIHACIFNTSYVLMLLLFAAVTGRVPNGRVFTL